MVSSVMRKVKLGRIYFDTRTCLVLGVKEEHQFLSIFIKSQNAFILAGLGDLKQVKEWNK